MKGTLLIKIFLFLVTRMIYAQSGEIDKTFNPVIGAGADATVKCIIEQTDGKIIIAGEFISYDYKSKNRIARLNADGTTDNSFNVGTGANATINTAALQADGKIVIIGGFTSYNGIAKNRIARINADGTLDTTFEPGSGFNSYNSIAVQTDGKILIGGYFTSYNGVARKHIARLNSDGTLDTSFGSAVGLDSTVKEIVLQPDGKILIIGDFLTFDGTSRKNIARLNADGTLDITFNSGNGANGIETIALQTDGKILIGGYFSTYNFTSSSCFARLNSDGTLDSTFNLGTGFDGSVRKIISQSNGKMIIAGSFTSYNGTAKNSLARLNSDGTLDTTLDSGTGANESIHAMTIKTDGKILTGGNFTSFNTTLIGRLTQLNTDGTIDTTFLNPGGFGSGSNQSISRMALQQDGKILITGEFLSSYNGIATKRLARLNADGTLDTAFNTGTGPSSSVYAITTQPDGKILIGGRFGNYNGVSRNGIARLNSDGTVDTTFNIGTGVNNSIYSIAVQTDGKILISGLFTSFNGTTRNRFARLNADGTLDTSFDPEAGPDSVIYSIVTQTDGKIIIAGTFKNYKGTPKQCITRLNSDGTIDTSFNLGIEIEWNVDVVKIQPDGKLLISGTFIGFTGANSPPPGLARLNADGSLDPSFVAQQLLFVNPGTNPYTNPSSMAIQSDGKIIIGGTITSYGGTPILNIARLNTDGTHDTTFVAGTGIANNQGISSSVDNIIMLPDGKILISGVFTLYNGITVGRVARILSGTTTLDVPESYKSSFVIYPNPASSKINFSQELTEIAVYDMMGKKKNIPHTSDSADISALPNGIYILKGLENNKTIVQKIIKK
ncbi:T9SS type A sorting domain-containing protein [Flavobacterium sp. 17A]|uniref:T9SS type A sorting domain-containing protein n=1 Tax=Flavobacterium potami TaxID=2872310 RepID=A0A9X1KS51_9FLAO|nr:T9SS type A sorting domain-containing protein [Flavobacterium potami]MBZ4035946.1 T9SS type A sorting domain-containing protein [Flavobacterium potami]